MKCFFHSADLDGHCSGAIVKMKHPECETIGINYGQKFPWESIQEGEKVFMVDFTLQPFDDMERLYSMCDLRWVDHHKTEVEESRKRGFLCGGLREIGRAGCELTWEYMFNSDSPEAVRLLGRYDVWDHSDPKTLPFQYGMRTEPNTYPDNQTFWKRLFHDNDGHYVRQFIIDGDMLLKYEEQQNAKFCKAYAFETTLAIPLDPQNFPQMDDRLLPFKAICCNRGFTNSKVFDSIYDPEKHDLMITFCRLKPPAHKWTVSLYSTKEDVDCGTIARQFGGGGHKGAAGFQCEQLPFEH